MMKKTLPIKAVRILEKERNESDFVNLSEITEAMNTLVDCEPTEEEFSFYANRCRLSAGSLYHMVEKGFSGEQEGTS